MSTYEDGGILSWGVNIATKSTLLCLALAFSRKTMEKSRTVKQSGGANFLVEVIGRSRNVMILDSSFVRGMFQGQEESNSKDMGVWSNERSRAINVSDDA
jgi:hypothetical protein